MLHVKRHFIQLIILLIKIVPHLSNKPLQIVNGSVHPLEAMQNELLPLLNGLDVGGWGPGVAESWNRLGWLGDGLDGPELSMSLREC